MPAGYLRSRKGTPNYPTFHYQPIPTRLMLQIWIMACLTCLKVRLASLIRASPSSAAVLAACPHHTTAIVLLVEVVHYLLASERKPTSWVGDLRHHLHRPLPNVLLILAQLSAFCIGSAILGLKVRQANASAMYIMR